ncbi:metal ABC transporter ATP-binding protein [Campylobacter sp. MIT 21-1685]|uniref:metal ABC transporter ATP-binding protein n=1 Tax=unclassified Campylobacter TaxID=2593542 RepID=UPI00224AD0C6|nr:MULTISPECIES: metal ABC transporter ATP-binding protein [unclassified Campylobacter]MCX2683774.1 metal ABC transporter ATP-binding protein [Campylobacter sp. MIT 21-1684]MCX2752051.1 metal ABC transporter ATP-binding protein [Campylobacter sp. MIT 21-1682]MCX2808251.1 metal ABC transporter ATP-binding protein [Campylobacter sp. MIT 21-1685]
MQFFHISNLTYAYKDETVLHNITLEYDSKDFLTIIGPNGGGKSTLLKLILGLLEYKNSICFSNITKEEIGYVPQNNFINPNFPARVLEIVLMGLVGKKNFGFYNKKDKQKALEALDKVAMADFSERKITELSGGQRQRVLIARTLIDECKMLLLDEPTTSVDTKNAVQIFELLQSLHKQGIGIIAVCHDINIVLAYSDVIAYLNKELFLHSNPKEKQKSEFLKHLYENHSHFCDVELSLNACFCEQSCENKELCEKECKKVNNA